MAMFVIKKGVPICRCKLCGDYYLPVEKRNKAYCPACRVASYDRKVKDDKILSSYRKIYSTQSARKQRNHHRPNIEARFEVWKAVAQATRDACKAGEITLEQMEEALSSKAWLEGQVEPYGKH